MILEEKPFPKDNGPIPKGKNFSKEVNFWISNQKCNGHKMAAETSILEWTVWDGDPWAKAIYIKEQKITEVTKQWVNKSCQLPTNPRLSRKPELKDWQKFLEKSKLWNYSI